MNESLRIAIAKSALRGGWTADGIKEKFGGDATSIFDAIGLDLARRALQDADNTGGIEGGVFLEAKKHGLQEIQDSLCGLVGESRIERRNTAADRIKELAGSYAASTAEYRSAKYLVEQQAFSSIDVARDLEELAWYHLNELTDFLE